MPWRKDTPNNAPYSFVLSVAVNRQDFLKIFQDFVRTSEPIILLKMFAITIKSLFLKANLRTSLL